MLYHDFDNTCCVMIFDNTFCRDFYNAYCIMLLTISVEL